MVHYTPGQEYRDHVDYFSSADERVVERMGAAPCRKQGPPRFGLNGVEQDFTSARGCLGWRLGAASLG